MFNYFETRVPPFPDGQPERPPETLRAFVWHYTKPFKWLLLAMMVTASLHAFFEVFLYSTVGNFVDWMMADAPETFFETHGRKLAIIAILLLTLWPAITFLDSALEHQGLLGNFSMQIRWRAHRYLLRQSTSFFANDFSGRLSTKVMQTALSIRDSVVSLMGIAVYVVVYFFSAVILFAHNDLRLMIPLVVWLGGYACILSIFLPRLRKISEDQSDARSLMTGRVVDAYTNIQTVKMFSSNNAEETYVKNSMWGLLRVVYKQMRLVTVLQTSLIFLNGLLVLGVGAMGLWLWSKGHLTAGAVAFALGLTMRIQGMSQWFLWEIARLFEGIGTTQDGMKTISQAVSVRDQDKAPALKVPAGAINFDHVNFHYGKAQGVLDDFSLTIKPGERIGLVGRSGAGKSTLVNLLLRLYDVEQGRILIDRQNICDVTQESLRQQIAMVTQDTSLLHRTISENIAYGREDASEADIWQAAKLAKADEFINELEDNEGNKGMDAKVGERGVKLSGGQRQRIAIARVILKNAPILVLDEATSALDSEVESAIQEQLDGLMAGKTVIAIAHRLSTIAAMDRLIVLDNGKIIEQGPHETLLAGNGVYAQLWARQSGGFLGRQEKMAGE